MTGIAAYLDALSEPDARAALLRCCASSDWVNRMIQTRPFLHDTRLFAAADRAWNALKPADWLEAFAAHPRIGDRPAPTHAATSSWSSAEQAGMDRATAQTARAIAEGNRRYEERFGHVFLICATGKTGDEMLHALNERLNNDPDTELRIAAAEQAKITRIRLQKLVQT